MGLMVGLVDDDGEGHCHLDIRIFLVATHVRHVKPLLADMLEQSRPV